MRMLVLAVVLISMPGCSRQSSTRHMDYVGEGNMPTVQALRNLYDYDLVEACRKTSSPNGGHFRPDSRLTEVLRLRDALRGQLKLTSEERAWLSPGLKCLIENQWTCNHWSSDQPGKITYCRAPIRPPGS